MEIRSPGLQRLFGPKKNDKLPLHQSAQREFVFFVMQIISDNPSVLCSLGAYPTARLQRAFGMEIRSPGFIRL